MVPPGWEEDADNWTEEYGDEFGEEEEFEDGEEGFLDDEELDDKNGEEEDEDELESLIDEGEALIEEGEYAKALELFREAAERFPESALPIYKVGQTALMLLSDGIEENTNWQDDDDLAGYYEEALGAFDTALSLDAEYYPALNSLGALYMLADNAQAAVESWERSLEINPDQEDVSSAMNEAKTQLD